MISLVKLLRGFGVQLSDWKIHLATGANPSPLEAFIRGDFEKWQAGQTKKNFECQMIVSLIQMDRERWLFAGVYRVLGVRREVKMPYFYRTKLVPELDDLIGRVVVHFRRDFRASYLLGERYADRLEVSEVLPRRFNVEPFPGYNRVIVSHEHLKTIVESCDASWKTALSSVKGVYLIVDTQTGQAFVGSATGNSGLWQRWQDYA